MQKVGEAARPPAPKNIKAAYLYSTRKRPMARRLPEQQTPYAVRWEYSLLVSKRPSVKIIY